MIKSLFLSSALLAMCSVASASIISSSNSTDFNLTSESFPTTSLGSSANIVSASGNIALDNAQGIGSPVTGTHGYDEWASSSLVGEEYVLNGDENFDVIFSSLQNVFAMTYEDDSVASLFTLTFFNGSSNVGSTSFTTSIFDTAQFIGFVSDVAFNKVEIREDDGSQNTNEYFQFYTATVKVPEPTGVALISLAILGLSFQRRVK